MRRPCELQAVTYGHMTTGSRKRLAIVVTHPIQYFSHVYRRLAAFEDWDVKVLYGTRIGLDRYHDPGMGVELAWDCDLLGGFDHEFLPGAEGAKRLGWRALARLEVADALSRFEPDAVLLHGYAHPLVWRAWRWARSRDRLTLLFGDGNGRTSSLHPAPTRWLWGAATSQVIRSMSFILSLGEANELYWRQRGARDRQLRWAPMLLPSPDVVAPSGSPRSRIREEMRRELGIDDEATLIMCCGKMIPLKRTIDVVRAIDRAPGTVGLYVGDGRERRACESAAQSGRHRFVGFRNVSELAGLYAASDVLCHAADRENYGLVIGEAAANGLPIVSSAVVGAVGERSHGRLGRNVDTFVAGDVNAMACLFRSIAADAPRRQRMARESRLIAEEMENACFDGIRGCIFGSLHAGG